MGCMKRKWLPAALLALLSFLGGRVHASAQDEFWKWFQANEPRLYAVKPDSAAIFDELAAQMHAIDPDLTFEFGPVQDDGRREFVISAGGIRSAFSAVEALYAKAPALKRWTWVKFRPRRLPISDVSFGGKTVHAADVRYLMAKDGDKVGIMLFLNGYNDAEKATLGQIGYLLLDEALGEYAMETQVGAIEFQPTTSTYFLKSRPIAELPARFDEYVPAVSAPPPHRTADFRSGR
jgi:hypothetical protein